MTGQTLLYVVNVDWFFISHRLAIAEAALRKGYRVHLACGLTGRRAELEAAGIIVHELPLDRRDTGPLGLIRVFTAILSVMRVINPNVVHLVTIKPVLVGGLAARIAKIERVVAAISGLGFVFIAQGWTAQLRRLLLAPLYRIALGRRNVTVIVQNPDDGRLVSAMAGLDPSQLVTIRGSGVNLSRCSATPLPGGEPVVVFSARLLVDKGLREFIAAAKMCKRDGLQARFVVAGEVDPGNPATVTQDEVEAWRSEGFVDFVGFEPDIANLFSHSHVVVLPSYREGLPKVLLEAAACGRAVVTTDVPGCRHAVDSGRTALLVPARMVEPLATAIRRLVEDRDACIEMGQAARQLAEAEFSIDQVVETHLAIYAGVAGSTA